MQDLSAVTQHLAQHLDGLQVWDTAPQPMAHGARSGLHRRPEKAKGPDDSPAHSPPALAERRAVYSRQYRPAPNVPSARGGMQDAETRDQVRVLPCSFLHCCCGWQLLSLLTRSSVLLWVHVWHAGVRSSKPGAAKASQATSSTKPQVEADGAAAYESSETILSLARPSFRGLQAWLIDYMRAVDWWSLFARPEEKCNANDAV